MHDLIGIDLGTTNSAVAVCRDGVVRVLENRLGEALTPSVVAVERQSPDLLVGRPAKELLALAPERAAATFKRSMGEDREYPLAGQALTAVELSACVLRALREDAERALGTAVRECVITVPAYFSEPQRFATIRAGEIAGLEVKRILNEPTGAALAHGLHGADEDQRFLVFDLGGGTFDVCVMERFAGTLQVMSVAGESRLGGEDFTRRLALAALADAGVPLERAEVGDPAAMATLLKRCELAKRRLSEQELVEIVLPPFGGILDGERSYELTRVQAEKIWEPLTRRLLAPCRSALRGAQLDPQDLAKVLLVGGATRMPVVRAFVRELFGREAEEGVDADLAVVHGAAIQGALLAEDHAVEDVVVTDILSHSLGVNISKLIAGKRVEGYFSPVVHRNTVVPTSRVETFETVEANQRKVTFQILEGESRRAEGNRELGRLEVSGIPKGPPGQVVEVRFTYDVNGVLEVEAVVEATGARFSKILTRSRASLSDRELRKARARLQKLKEDPLGRPENRDLLLRAESLWRDCPPEKRTFLGDAMDAFEAAVATRNSEEIAAAFDVLQRTCEQIDGGERW